MKVLTQLLEIITFNKVNPRGKLPIIRFSLQTMEILEHLKSDNKKINFEQYKNQFDPSYLMANPGYYNFYKDKKFSEVKL